MTDTKPTEERKALDFLDVMAELYRDKILPPIAAIRNTSPIADGLCKDFDASVELLRTALLDQHKPAPDVALPDAERAGLVEWLDERLGLIYMQLPQMPEYPGYWESVYEEEIEPLEKIRALIVSAPAPMKVTPEFITEFARSLIGRTTTERVDLLRDLFAELGVRVEETK
jgi:hypothetical protein